MFYLCHHLSAENKQLNQRGGTAHCHKSRSIAPAADGTIPYLATALQGSALTKQWMFR